MAPETAASVSNFVKVAKWANEEKIVIADPHKEKEVEAYPEAEEGIQAKIIKFNNGPSKVREGKGTN